MGPDTEVSSRIGPQLSLADVEISRPVGERFGRLYGSDEPPETADDWATAMRDAIETKRDRAPTIDDLCTTPSGDHAFVGRETEQTYICVLDPLVYPFLSGETGTIRSTTPVREKTVEFEIRAGDFDVSREDAVVSLGVSDHVTHVEELDVDTIYRQVCGYIQTFEDRTEYATWADDVEAATMALPAEKGVAVARELAMTLFDGESA